ncbi:Cyanate hydratase [Aphelenchoides besseyi]|nr:Cyanate hydratase [Aphelenchoides besseyi]KAI6207780.1 Cyanate hydratase [Aphelenchoides besseyi]
MITSRAEVTQRIIAAKIQRQLKWSDVARELTQSKEWTTAAVLGQMQLSKEEAKQLGRLFGLDDECVAWLQIAPYKGSNTIPSDPCLYRFYEAIGVYGPALKELIHEEFGDGIMSAIDFSVHMEREPNPMGDRVKLTWSGKFLPYKKF